MTNARAIVVMGVSGCGTTSVAEGLAATLSAAFIEGDSLHPPANIDKMSAGIPLTDDDRWPWLDRVSQELASQAPVIIGCSALRRAYRDCIRAGAGGPVCFVHLAGSRALIAARMVARSGHFMPASLLDSQFAALEPPGPDEDAVTVDIDQPLDRLVSDILLQLNSRAAG